MVVLPASADGKPYLPNRSFFTLYEWQILEDNSQNADVTKVTAYVDSADGSAPIGKEYLIWPC